MSQNQRPKCSGTFFLSEPHGLTRIVYTSDIDKRWSEWWYSSPYHLRMIGMITTNETAIAVADSIRWGLDTRASDYEVDTWKSFRGDQDFNPKTIKRVLQWHFDDLSTGRYWYKLREWMIKALPLESPES